MAGALLLDTEAWIRALENAEPYATAVVEARSAIVPGLVLAELDYWLASRRKVMHTVLSDIAAGAYEYQPPTAADLSRAREIDAKFSALNLGVVGGSVVALGERLGVRRLLTADSDFTSVRFGPRWSESFELAVPLPRRRR